MSEVEGTTGPGPSERSNDGSSGRLAVPESALERSSRRGHPRPESPLRVEKPWGHEIVWAHTDLYAGKTLHVKAGHSLSLQFHEEKDETLYLLSGSLRFRVGPGLDSLQDVQLTEGTAIRIEPGVLHWIEAHSDTVLLEVSTPELDDVVRVRDRYGRALVPEESPE